MLTELVWLLAGRARAVTPEAWSPCAEHHFTSPLSPSRLAQLIAALSRYSNHTAGASGQDRDALYLLSCQSPGRIQTNTAWIDLPFMPIWCVDARSAMRLVEQDRLQKPRSDRKSCPGLFCFAEVFWRSLLDCCKRSWLLTLGDGSTGTRVDAADVATVEQCRVARPRVVIGSLPGGSLE